VEPKYVTIEQAAAAVNLHPGTLYNWASRKQNRLREEHGLRRLGRRTMIELPVFCEAVAKGLLA